eukprot:TRINITY_DN47138_c0_g1_i1.p1 TRINITY_DN47138_c0_g1~~TRINITY_DN47138_c0_g1_i1.p1  ORF type:complete len:603 (+),score=114.24 TRINITY_DN47138_c0_g1_i1:78-1811(+)
MAGDSEPTTRQTPLGSCGHNDWDHVRSAAGKAHLRCRACQSRAVLPLSHPTYRQRCCAFREPDGCAQGEQCQLLHVRKEKQRLEERRALHGDSVLVGVNQDQLRGHQIDPSEVEERAQQLVTPTAADPEAPCCSAADAIRNTDPAVLPVGSAFAAATSRHSANSESSLSGLFEGSGLGTGEPPPLLDELSAVGATDTMSQREAHAKMKEQELLQQRRHKAGLADRPYGNSVQFLNAHPELRAPGQRSAPVADEDQSGEELGGVWCPVGRYFHPDGPPPYPNCQCVARRRKWSVSNYRPASGGRMPALFISLPFGAFALTSPRKCSDFDPIYDILGTYQLRLPTPPAAILVVSMNWRREVCTVTAGRQPKLLHDFPAAWSAPIQVSYAPSGCPQLAQRCAELLHEHSIPCHADPFSPIEHQGWTAGCLIDPEAKVPIVQLSLTVGACAATDVSIGRALAPLRHEGVLIVGSGSTFHVPREGVASAPCPLPYSPSCLIFDTWLTETLCGDSLSTEQRLRRLHEWREIAPENRQAHPVDAEEQLRPLFVLFGAGAGGACRSLCDVGCRNTHLVWSQYEWL